MNEVHGPPDIGMFWRWQRIFRLVDPAFWFALLELQSKAVIQPLSSLVVDDPAFVAKHKVNAWTAKSGPLSNDLFDPLNDLMIVSGFGHVSARGSIQPHYLTGPTFAQVESLC